MTNDVNVKINELLTLTLKQITNELLSKNYTYIFIAFKIKKTHSNLVGLKWTENKFEVYTFLKINLDLEIRIGTPFKFVFSYYQSAPK